MFCSLNPSFVEQLTRPQASASAFSFALEHVQCKSVRAHGELVVAVIRQVSCKYNMSAWRRKHRIP